MYFVLNCLKQFRSLAANRLAVYFTGRQAELAGAGNDDLVSVHQVVDCINGLIHRNLELFACLDDMGSCNAGQDVMVGRSSDKDVYKRQVQ